MKKHVNIPIFIPHLACPNECTFCNQRVISATQQAPDIQTTHKLIQRAISTIADDQTCEIAFFGGSFTGIERDRMQAYLACAEQYRESISGIRLSTRPDYITPEILNVLQEYGVTTIELGMQSMNEQVLHRCRRGHLPQDTVRAASMIRERGFSLVLQMMIGLPGDTAVGALDTAKAVIDMEPDAVRIYPCIVLKDTELCREYLSGRYRPMSLENAVDLCAQLLLLFEQYNIPVIRMGLFSEPGLMGEDRVAGPYHPAFGELVENACYYQLLRDALQGCENRETAVISVARGELSKAIGQHRCNVKRLEREKNIAKIAIKEASFLEKRAIKVE